VKSSLKRWVGRVPDISAVFTRFPVPVALMGIVAGIFIFIDTLQSNDHLGRLIVGLIIGAYLGYCVTIAREGRGLSRLIPVQIAIAVIVALLAWFSKGLQINLAMAVGAVLLILGNMVIWRKSRDDLHVWDFTHKIWTGAGFAVLGSIIFTVGTFAIGAALKSLFGININELIERLILPIGLGFLAPLYWLSTIPPTDESYAELDENPGFVSKAVAFLGMWLLSPLTLIYAFILIAYAIKIILAGNLPKGEIAQLTTPFLLIGTLTWLVLEPPFIKNKAFAKLFRKLWWPLSIPAALMLAIATAVRVDAYGLTPERIMLVMCVICALGMGAWFTFGPKDRRDIRWIPRLPAILLAIGALTAGWLSQSNQTSRAVSSLKVAGIMSAEGIMKPRDAITISDEEAARKAKGALIYLVRNDAWSVITRMFKGAENIPTEDGKLEQNLYVRLGLEDVSTHRSDAMDYVNFNHNAKPINVSGYETLSGSFWLNRNSRVNAATAGTMYGIRVTLKGDNIIIEQNGAELTRFDIQDWIDSQTIVDNQMKIAERVIPVYNENGRLLAIVIESGNFMRYEEKTLSVEVKLMTAGF